MYDSSACTKKSYTYEQIELKNSDLVICMVRDKQNSNVLLDTDILKDLIPEIFTN